MKKVVLLGDSIRELGYGTKVPELLKDEFEVWQPNDNCRFAYFTFRWAMVDWRENIEGAEVIHWNNGIWDACIVDEDGSFTPKEEYVRVMLRIARLLKTLGKKVIFATTTPTPAENTAARDEVIAEYNEALVPKLREMGIIINDLYSAVKTDVRKYIDQNDMLHLSKEGIDFAAEKVAQAIRKAASEN